ncbi:NADH/Ubiquinone/plastoquinone (complex I) [Nitrosococcus halophilus Nc 4]|uniref:NADH/Ubiquinone/plastoquinone (Complex I) n=1 Tax=Nitrosococcus halophilus (strain Nc4) TaxID=472759 RepID=D5BYH0_NITHN|nr:proton-conducting transporter membrane subunit [Nitrosococcus halophilus]ADE15958.1 NADH/Ubiquinone/plastoquinone (complex I) [Nitrosococcus halophilus Nc 4]
MLSELIVLPPFLAALFLGIGILSGRIAGEASERLTGRITLYAAVISLIAVGIAIVMKLQGTLAEHVVLGTWFESGSYRINISFIFDNLSLAMAATTIVLSLMVVRFSVNYMHREVGYHRFFLVLSLFVGAMLLLATAGSSVLTFVGWELAGVTSYLLIAYAYDRPIAANNATRAFVTNRIGDAGFVLGIFFAFFWIGSIEWTEIASNVTELPHWQARVLATCFLLAAIAKSAQVPLAPWLARAVEGPTPSSAIFYGAVMIHAGIYLILRLEPVFEHAPLVMGLLAAVGLVTAVYGFICGLTQTDAKSALIFSTTAQVGLMFLEAGLGFWDLALWHLCAHAVFRGYQFLTVPSIMHQGSSQPIRSVPKFITKQRWLYLASLQRLWLENLGDSMTVRPIQRLGSDLHYFDSHILDSVAGLPVTKTRTAPTIREANQADPEVIRVSGLGGRVVYALANLLHWFEDRLILRAGGQEKVRTSRRRLSIFLNRFEALLNEPRFLVALIIAALLAAIQ